VKELHKLQSDFWTPIPVFWPLSFLGRGEGVSRHDVFFLVFHDFSVLANSNIRGHLGSGTHGLQSELYNFHAICK